MKKIFSSVVLVIILIGTLFLTQKLIKKSQPISEINITLTSNKGTFPLNELISGQWSLLYFGYTTCPDVCPTSLTKLTKALTQLTPPQIDNIKLFFISVDPKRDTPEKMAQYSSFFHKNLIGLTGELSEIQRLAQWASVSFKYEKVNSALEYLVDHSSEFILISPDGRIYHRFPHDVTANELAEKLKSIGS